MSSLEEVADSVAEKVRRDNAKLINDVRAFEGLREHAGWKRLYQNVLEARETFMLTLAKRLMADVEVPSKEIHYYRGYYEGALAVLKRPEEVEKNLEQLADRAWREAQLQYSDQEDEIPYA